MRGTFLWQVPAAVEVLPIRCWRQGRLRQRQAVDEEIAADFQLQPDSREPPDFDRQAQADQDWGRQSRRMLADVKAFLAGPVDQAPDLAGALAR